MYDQVSRTEYRERPVEFTDIIQKETFAEQVSTEFRDVPVYGFDLVPDTIIEQIPREVIDIVQERRVREVPVEVIDIVPETRYRTVPVTVYEQVEV